jgi:hypothetical protein
MALSTAVSDSNHSGKRRDQKTDKARAVAFLRPNSQIAGTYLAYFPDSANLEAHPR